MTIRILKGDCREILRTLPDESVHCVVTSPPYFMQRDYGMPEQIGLEPSPGEFAASIVAALREARRALRDDGVMWLNIGDSYNNRTRIRQSSHKPIVAGDRKSWAQSARDGEVRMTINAFGLKEKDLLGIPWQLALALRLDGWWLRQEVIWNKPIAKLDVASDRPSTTHEHLFLLSKSKTYQFDGAALPEFARGSVWNVAAVGYEGHGAAFPPALIEPCILAGCPKGGTVLDPFGGAGTTGLVADRLGRDAILIELNPEYADMAERRLRRDAGMFADVATAARPCTCHPDDNPPRPCPRRYAYSECVAAAESAQTEGQ